MGWLAQVVRVFIHAEAALALNQKLTTAPLTTGPLIFITGFSVDLEQAISVKCRKQQGLTTYDRDPS